MDSTNQGRSEVTVGPKKYAVVKMPNMNKAKGVARAH
jgi:hypothetical protein